MPDIREVLENIRLIEGVPDFVGLAKISPGLAVPLGG